MHIFNEVLFNDITFNFYLLLKLHCDFHYEEYLFNNKNANQIDL